MGFKEWYEKYTTKKIINLYDELNEKDINILKKLGIKIEKNKVYTESEFEIIRMKVLRYYRSKDMTKEELKYAKILKFTKVSKKDYYYIIDKLENLDQKYYKYYSKKIFED